MKLSYKTIPDFLKTPAKSAVGVLIYGPDGGQVRERTSEILATLLGTPHDPFSITELDETSLKENPTRLNEELSAISLLGGAKVVVLRDLSDKQAPLVEQAAEFANAENYMLAIGGDLDSRSALRKLFEQHKHLAALPCYRDDGASFAQMIRKKLEAYGFAVPREVVDYLMAALGNDRGVTYSELEKIALYAHGEKQLTLEMVRLLVGDNQEHGLDDVCNAYASGDMLAFERHWQSLIRSGGQPIMLLRVMMRHFHKLHALKTAMEELRLSAEAAIDQCKPPIFFKEKPRLKNQLQRLSLADITATLSMLLEAERQCKSVNLPQPMMASAQLLHHHTQHYTQGVL